MSRSAIIFDMDGLLIDSEPCWQQAEIRVFNGLGVPLTPELCEQTIGLRIDEVAQHWHQRYPCFAPEFQKIALHVVEEMAGLLATSVSLLPGVEQTLEWALEQGVPLGVASSSPLRLIDVCVDRFGLRTFFQTLCSAEFETYGKPHPAVYLRACDVLGASPSRALAFEDSVNGVIAAKAARMSVIAVTGQLHVPAQMAIADEVYFKLSDFLAQHKSC